MEQRTANEMSHLGAQLRQLCGALPDCRALDSQLAGVRETALADLYITLQDLSSLYYEARLGSQCQAASNPALRQRSGAVSSSGRALADYLFAHPDRCDETLRSLAGEFPVAEAQEVFKKPSAQLEVSDFAHAPVFPTGSSGGSLNERLSRKGYPS